MKVKIYGPNLNDQSKGSFHVHAEGCRDGVKLEQRGHMPWTIDAKSRDDVGDTIYEDMIWEGSMRPGEGKDDCYFAPCCADLKEES